MKKLFTLLTIVAFIACTKENPKPEPQDQLKTTVWTVGKLQNNVLYERRFTFKNDSLLYEDYRYTSSANYINNVDPVNYDRIRYKCRITTDSLVYSNSQYGVIKFKYVVNNDSLCLYNSSKKIEWVYYSKKKVRNYKLYWE